ncbi:MAG: peptidylprolyl isomerase [Deltaproteobacteria bacterium]|nr:peptidylprolyl isomerase [Deltaproteobacteria bacterium]MBW2052486.1 peptidylprolyl isomerase [Deltaproteobacteria bacterium]MBW2141154.1 peptidylprolyl isomerase [Deltaproteobacteria bacterium]MBW2322631.1 peptidylprolyl isomerase [Deltaproteobacteria bacterium]
MEIVYSQDVITPEEVVKFLSFTRQSYPIVAEIIKNKEVLKKARELNLEVSDEELQAFSDNFRNVCGLYSVDETLDFLKNAGLSEDDFETFCEISLLTSSLKEHLATENKIEEYFVNNRSELDLVRISSIMVKDEGLANEIVLQVTEDEEDFHALARKHSVDERTKNAGGYIGFVTRDMLWPEVAAKVFNAAGGDLLGPFSVDEFFQLVLVEELRRAELNEDFREIIKQKIFDEWASQFFKDGIRITA